MNTEIINVVTSKEKGGKMRLGMRLADGFDCIYNVYIGGRENVKRIRQFLKLVFVL